MQRSAPRSAIQQALAEHHAKKALEYCNLRVAKAISNVKKKNSMINISTTRVNINMKLTEKNRQEENTLKSPELVEIEASSVGLRSVQANTVGTKYSRLLIWGRRKWSGSLQVGIQT